VAAIISVAVIVLFTPKGKTVYTPRRLKGFTIIIIFVLIPGLFYVTDQYTGGILVKRYQGATYATEMGFKDQSINTLTTNRWNLAVSDIQIWQDHFVFGVGAGQSTFKRTDYGLERIAPHSELTRFLAEHGIFGLFIALIFVLFPLLKYIRARTPLQKAMVAFCFILAIASSFHSAMRTFITPFFYGFACANFISSTPQTKRKEELKNEELQPLSE
jgi:O-antigen ligase